MEARDKEEKAARKEADKERRKQANVRSWNDMSLMISLAVLAWCTFSQRAPTVEWAGRAGGWEDVLSESFWSG